MNFLIVEDSEDKLETLKSILINNLENVKIDVSDNLRDAMKNILTNSYDYILLDMNFPLFKNEEINRNSGSIILENIYYLEEVDLNNFDTKIILTSSEDYKALRSVFPIETLRCESYVDYSKDLLKLVSTKSILSN